MTAALAADALGLDTLVVEKSPQFGGSTALSGGGIWVPGAPSQRKEGCVRIPTGCSNTCGKSRWARQRCAAAAVRRNRARDDGVPGEAQPVVRVRLEAGLCRLLPGRPAVPNSAAQSTFRRLTCASWATRNRNYCIRWRWHRRESRRPQGSSALLPSPPELARQGRPREADLADVPGSGLR